MQAKDSIREMMKEKRSLVTNAEFEKYNHAIFTEFLKLTEYTDSDVLLSYVSLQKEVDTRNILMTALRAGKQVAVPKVLGKRRMDFYLIESLDELKRGRFGIQEPMHHNPMQFDANKKYLMIMPLLAFDEKRNRIGYGGGFYDCYLQEHSDKNITTIALAYDFQLVESIDAEPFDQKPNLVFTESKKYQ